MSIDNTECKTSESNDINDIFDSIALVEENLTSRGFNEGIEKGKIVGEYEGYHLGYHRGAEIGSEIGFYKGFLQAFINTADKETLSHHIGIVDKLSGLIESFPKCNDINSDMISLRDRIRSLYKRLCSLLKTDPRIPEATSLTF